MSNSELPEGLNPYALADKSTKLVGMISSHRLTRLQEATESLPEGFEVELLFDRDGSGRRVIEGAVDGEVSLICQRCLQACRQPVTGQFRLALVYNDEMAKSLPADLDPLLWLPDAQLDVAEIVEDELLLSLPMHALHPEGECTIETQFGDEPEAPTEERAPSPFDVLKDLK